MRSSSGSVAVWGHYHGGNLGDDFVVETIVAAIRSRRPDIGIVAVSLDPEDARRRHRVDAFPLNRPRRFAGPGPLRRALRLLARPLSPLAAAWFALRCLRFLRDVDLVVVAGSGQLLDEWAGFRVHPAAFFRWSLLARLARTRVALASVGAGPIDGRLSRRLIAAGVRWAGFVSVRDPHTREVLAAAGVRRRLDLVPDMAFGAAMVPGPPEGALMLPRPAEAPVVGLNVMAHQDPRYWPRGDEGRYVLYVQKMATVAEKLAARGTFVRVFSSQTRADPRVGADLAALLASRGTDPHGRVELVFDRVTTTTELFAAIRSCDAILAARYHTILLPLLVDVPVVALSYHPKTVDLMQLVGQQHRTVGIDDFDPDELVDLVQEALAGFTESEAERLAALREQHAAAVRREFDVLFGEVAARADRRQLTSALFGD